MLKAFPGTVNPYRVRIDTPRARGYSPSRSIEGALIAQFWREGPAAANPEKEDAMKRILSLSPACFLTSPW